ncbi:MAG: type II secretion system protein [Bdellovibrionales bacterium]|nr:type II secretion system protein [Bdellovibrionales bacterium]
MNFFRQNLASLKRKLAAKASLGHGGFTLIEAMILAAMMAVIVTAFSTYTFQRAKQIEMANKRKSYQQIQNQIKAAAGQAEAVVQSEESAYCTDPAVCPTPTP